MSGFVVFVFRSSKDHEVSMDSRKTLRVVTSRLTLLRATAADHHLGAAAGTEGQPRRDWIVLIGPTGPQMTDAARAAILPRHACPGTVWCTVPKQNLAVGLRHRACHLSCGPGAVGTSQLNSALPLIVNTRGQDTEPSCAIPGADDSQASRQRRSGATRGPYFLSGSARVAAVR